MTPDLARLIAIADHYWEFGFMNKARAGYADVLARDPSNWPAAFQLAWIDSGFGAIASDRIERLRNAGLPIPAAEVLDRLAERNQSGPFLDGSVSTWDIEALRAVQSEETATWWEERAAKAAAAGQYGLALACYGEAERIAPEMHFDPPPAFKAVPRPGNHLHAIRAYDQA